MVVYRVTVMSGLPRASRLVVASGLLLAELLCVNSTSAAEPRRTPDKVLEVFLSLREAAYSTPMSISPDGRTLAITLQGSHDHFARDQNPHLPQLPYVEEGLLGAEVILVDTASGEMLRPFPEGSMSWTPTWSPDGAMLAAYVAVDGASCLGIWDAKQHRARLLDKVTVLGYSGFQVPRWTPDSRRIVLLHCRGELDPQERTVRVLHNAPGPNYGLTAWDLRRPRQALVCVEAASGAMKLLADQTRTYGWRISPTGNEVACYRAGEDQDPAAQSYRFELTVARLDGSGMRTLAPGLIDTWGADSFEWSPDGKFIAAIVHDEAGKHRLYCVPTDGSKAVECLADESLVGWGGSAWGPAAGPRWNSSGSEVSFATRKSILSFGNDGKLVNQVVPKLASDAKFTWLAPPTSPNQRLASSSSLLVLSQGISRIERQTGETQPILAAWPADRQPQDGPLRDRTVSADGKRLYYTAQSLRKATQLCEVDLVSGAIRTLVDISPGYETLPLGKVKILEWHAPGGRLCKGALLLPDDYQSGTRLPMIVELYAGATDNGSLTVETIDSRLMLNPHVLAAAGYAVFRPDLPTAGNNPFEQVPPLVKLAIDRVVELGYADPQRIGLMGNSYGTYTVMSVLCQTNAYQAALVGNGTTDLLRTATDGGFAWVEGGQGSMGKSLWQEPQRYVDNSPLFQLERVATPVLLVRGGADWSISGHMEAAYNSLVRLKKPAELRIYPGQGHWPPSWARASQRDLHRRVLAWFGEHLTAK